MEKIKRLFNWNLSWSFFLIILVWSSQQLLAQTLAFPGAEGFGRFATGGRGGEVYIVTNLNDSGPGSFRDAVSKPNRIVVFEVGGVIKITTRIVVSPNITIAGQTAPGDGVVIYGNGITFTQASNTIVRYIRMRMGVGGDSGKDAVGVTDNGNNQIYDHVSVSWGRDENFSITGDADKITIQNSIISQGLQTHSCGGLLEPSGSVSLYRNLYIDNNTRNPKVKGTNQFVNNIIYNWGVGGAYIMGGSEGNSAVNIINNYFINGPNSTARVFSRGTPTFIPFEEGNYHDGNKNGVLDGSVVPKTEYEGILTFRETPYDYPMPENLLSASESYTHVIKNVGASYPFRDQVDAYVIDELLSLGTKGELISKETSLPTGGPGEVHGAPAPLDSDRDGMPNGWETSTGLNPNDPSDARIINNGGYSNLEVYINNITNTPAPDFLRPPTKVALNAVSPAQINVSWQDNSNRETGFIIERSTDGITYTVMDTLAENVVTFSSQDLQPNKLYYYKLKSINEAEISVYSVPVSIKTLTVPSAPDVPSAPSPSDLTRYLDTTNVTLKWTGSSNTLMYHLYFGTDPANLQHTSDTTGSAFVISGLRGNSTYYWRVDASNNLGQTTGDIWSFSTLKSFAQGIVGDWRFNATAGTLISDSSVYLNHGELMDITDFAWVPGKNNNAIDLKQATTSSHILISHDDQLYFNKNSFAISLWVKAPVQTSSSYLFHKGTFARNVNTGATGKWFGMEVKDGKIRFAVDDDVTKSEAVLSSSTFFINEWIHIVAIRDTENKKLRIYRNGKLEVEANDNIAGGIGQADPLIIANSNDLNVPFTGMLDDVKLFNYKLSQTEILRLFHTSPLPLQAFDPSIADNSILEGFDNVTMSWQGGINTTLYKLYFGTNKESLTKLSDVGLEDSKYTLTNLSPDSTYYWRVDAIGPEGIATGAVWTFSTGAAKGLVGHWRLDETSGFIANDNSKYHHNGSLIGLSQTGWQTEGKSGGSLKFVSPADTGAIAVSHANHLLFDQNAFTISLWVKIKDNTYIYKNTTGDDAYLIHKGTFEANTGKWYGIQLRDNKLTFAIDDGTTKNDIVVTVNATSPYNLFTDEWKHIVAIRDIQTRQLKLYIDGVLAAEKAYTAGSIGQAKPLTIGNSAEKKPYRDFIDDVRLYNYQLSENEIGLLYEDKTLTSKAYNPTPFNDTTGVNPDSLQLSWQGNALYYNVYFGTSPDNLELKASGLLDTTYSLTGLYNQKIYFWRIDAVGDGEVATGDTWSFTTSPYSNDPDSHKLFYCYPNPFTNKLNVEFKLLKNEQVNLSMYDLRGKLAHTFINGPMKKGQYKVEWNIESDLNLPKGIYTVVLRTSKIKLFYLVIKKD